MSDRPDPAHNADERAPHPKERSMDPHRGPGEGSSIPVTDQELDLLRRSVAAEPASMGALVEGMSAVTEIPYVC